MARDMIWELSRPLVDITKTAFEDGFKTQRGDDQHKGAPLYGWRLPKSIDEKKSWIGFSRNYSESQRERRCIVKISFSGPIVTNGKGTIDPIHPNAQKISYIARSTATKEGVPWFEDEEKDVLYSFDDLGMKKNVSFTDAERIIGDGPVFRIILSPENGEECNLEELGRRFIRESLSPALHVPLINLRYVMANHWNTDNPHVHILVSRSEFRKEELTGIDDSLIRISKGYIQSHRAMRDASRIATEIAGPVDTINKSIIERTKALDTRICSIDLLLMEIGKTMDDGYIEINDKAIKRQNKTTRKDMVSRLKELCHMKMGYGMKVEEKNTKYERYWKLSPFFWTKLRILNGDDSIPVEKEEMKDVSFEELPKEFEAKEQIITQDDREEDKVFIRLVDNYNRIHLFHASDGSKSKGLKER